MTDPLDNHAASEPSDDDQTSNATSLEDRLSAHFHGEAELIPVAESLGRPTSLDAVRERAEKRRSRRQAGVGAVAAACVAVVGFGALQLGSNDQENDVAAVETTTTLAAPADTTTDDADSQDTAGADPIAELLSNGGPELAWQEVTDLPEGASSFGIAATPDAFYLPASNGVTTTVYRSTDGLTWDTVAEGLPIVGFRIQASDGVLVLQGNPVAPIEADPFEPVDNELLISQDDGQTWSEIELPAPEPLEVEAGGIAVSQSATISAASIGDTLIVVQLAFVFSDIGAALEDDGIEHFGWEVTDEGIVVFDEDFAGEGELIRYEDLSAFADSTLTNEEIADLLQTDESSVTVYRSVSDGPFEPLELNLPAGIDFASVTTSSGVAILQIFGPEPIAYRSTDGLTWTEAESDISIEVFGPATSGQSVIGYGPNGLVESLDGGQTWAAVEVSPLVQPSQFVRSNLGATVVASGSFGPGSIASPVIELTKDNLTFSMSFEDSGEGDMVLTDNVTGEELRRITPDELDPDGENGPGLTFDEASETIEISSLETGELLFTFTVEELTSANPEMMPENVDDFGFVIGHSTDGETYGWIRADGLADSTNSFPMIVATDNVIMVSFDGPDSSEIFVATEVAR